MPRSPESRKLFLQKGSGWQAPSWAEVTSLRMKAADVERGLSGLLQHPATEARVLVNRSEFNLAWLSNSLAWQQPSEPFTWDSTSKQMPASSDKVAKWILQTFTISDTTGQHGTVKGHFHEALNMFADLVCHLCTDFLQSFSLQLLLLYELLLSSELLQLSGILPAKIRSAGTQQHWGF